jgi:signal transduction histidine kinase
VIVGGSCCPLMPEVRQVSYSGGLMHEQAMWMPASLGADGGVFRVLHDEWTAALMRLDSASGAGSGGTQLVGFEADPVSAVLADRGSSRGFLRSTMHPAALTLEALLRWEELATANRRKDEFLAVLGHELRSPLGSLQNAFCVLRSQTEGSAARHRTQALIERQLRHMTQLVDDLLDVSRIAHGHLRLSRQRIDLCVVVRDAVETLESEIRERNHLLSILLPEEPVWLQGDADRLEQVFVNLLANAARYTDEGGELAIRASTQDSQVVVRVRDSGIGIEPHVLPRIFDLFKQADEAAPHSKAGLGIGLALVRSLVESHGGSVTATSAGAGQGSEFSVRLPLEV